MRWPRLIEIEDQPWLPACLRDQVTDTLQFLIVDMNAYTPIIPELLWLIQQSPSKKVIDLCSGGSGPWLDLLAQIRKPEESIEEIILTDLFPNHGSLQASADQHPLLSYCPEAVNALKIDPELDGVRTLFSSFHHFPQNQAAAILQDAVDKRKPIGIFEFTERRKSHFLLLPLFTLSLFFKQLRKRPVTWPRLLWSCLIPVVPLIFMWDSFVSILRTYSQADLQAMIDMINNKDSFCWEIGESESPLTPLKNTFLIGYPKG